jgi:hypothetical protein
MAVASRKSGVGKTTSTLDVGATASNRARSTAPLATASARLKPIVPVATVGPVTRRQRFKGSYLLIAIPLVMAATFLWQLSSGLVHTDTAARQAVAVGQVSLTPDPSGTRIDFVLVDRVGQETTFTGNVNVSLRDPDGAVWQATRSVSPGDSNRYRMTVCWLAAPATHWSSMRAIGLVRHAAAAWRTSQSVPRPATTVP